MTQLTGSRGIGRNTALQIAAAVVGVVAVAAVGVSFGRWVVPANDSSSGTAGITNESATSAASIIAERHYELRGATGEFDAVNVQSVIVGESPASAIVQRHYEQRGQFGELGAQAPAVTTNSESPAAQIAQRHFELHGATGRIDEAR